MPKLQDEVIRLYERCQANLRDLPPPVSDDPTGHLTSMITAFCTELHMLTRGAPSNKTLVQGNEKTYQAYAKSIESTAPLFHASFRSDLKTAPDSSQGPVNRLEMFLDDVRNHIQKFVFFSIFCANFG